MFTDYYRHNLSAHAIVLAKVNIMLVKPVLPAACAITRVAGQCPGVLHCASALVWILSTFLRCRNVCCVPIKTPPARDLLCRSALAGLRMCGSGQVEVSLS